MYLYRFGLREHPVDVFVTENKTKTNDNDINESFTDVSDKHGLNLL